MGDDAIRRARPEDLGAICDLYRVARDFMHANGNPAQWPGSYPGMEDARGDLAADALWVLDEGMGPIGVMSVLPGPDPTYAHIEGDGWLDDARYWVMHRMAVARSGQGSGTCLLTWLVERHDNVRADTHRDNIPMQRALEKCGFLRRGTIICSDGTPRIAYHFVRAE